MAYHVVWSETARADLDEIEAYLAARSSPVDARRVIERIWQTPHKYTDFPFSARMIPEFQDRTRRETLVYEYRLMYRVEDDRIRILRVVHGRRLLKNVPGSFEEAPQETYSAA
jgi:addiction module RelE/StbE family toxin